MITLQDVSTMLCSLFSPVALIFLQVMKHQRIFLCTEDEVFHLLSSVDPTKAAGPDRLSARMLKHTATSITSAITTLFNMSITSGKIPCE